MYEFPFGAAQQLNLNWIINEIITLHKQLDPDYELPNFDTAFPYMNLNTLNLDWILRELKAIKDLAPTEDATLLKMVANALLAETYDAETQYNVDDIVYRDNEKRLFKCITTTPAGGEAWDSNKWVEIDVGEVLTDLLVNAITNVRYNDHKIQQEINGTYSDVIVIEDTPTDASDRLPSSKAVYNLNNAIMSVEKGLAIIVTGDTCSTAVPSGGYAYIKNNTHGLTEGLYKNKTASAFPTSGGTANSTVFEAVPSGGLNDIINSGAGYFRTADGTQICWGDFSATISDFSPYGTYYQGAGNPNEMFAQPFISAPNVVVTPYTNVWHTVLQVACSYEGFTNITVERQNNNTVTISDHYIAIGRWK